MGLPRRLLPLGERGLRLPAGVDAVLEHGGDAVQPGEPRGLALVVDGAPVGDAAVVAEVADAGAPPEGDFAVVRAPDDALPLAVDGAVGLDYGGVGGDVGRADADQGSLGLERHLHLRGPLARKDPAHEYLAALFADLLAEHVCSSLSLDEAGATLGRRRRAVRRRDDAPNVTGTTHRLGRAPDRSATVPEPRFAGLSADSGGRRASSGTGVERPVLEEGRRPGPEAVPEWAHPPARPPVHGRRGSRGSGAKPDGRSDCGDTPHPGARRR